MSNRDISDVLEELKQKLKEEEQKASDFKAETIRLREEFDKLSSDKEQAISEANEAKKDAKLAKDFKGTHYEVLIKDLFEIPSEKSRKQALYIFAGSIFITLLITYLSSAYFDTQNSKEMENRFRPFNQSIEELRDENSLLSNELELINKKLSGTNILLTNSDTNILLANSEEKLVKLSTLFKSEFKSNTEKIISLDKSIKGVNKELSDTNLLLTNSEKRLIKLSTIFQGEFKSATDKIISLENSIKRINKKLSNTNVKLTNSEEQWNKLSDTLQNELKSLKEKINLIEKNTIKINSNLLKENLTIKKALITFDKKISQPNQMIIYDQNKKLKIKNQVNWIVNYIENNKEIILYLSNYSSDINSLSIIYLLSIPNSKKSEIYYESYIEAFKLLNINSDILPKKIEDLIEMDHWFLNKLFSAYLISKLKHNNKWSFRKTDRIYSSYIESNPKYNLRALGVFKVVNYKKLATSFNQDLKAVIARLKINDKFDIVQIPRTIFYKSDGKENDKKLSNAFSNKKLEKKDSRIIIDISKYPLQFNKIFIEKIQRRLYYKGFLKKTYINGKHGPATTRAIKKYEKSEGLPSTGLITLKLLDALGIQAMFSDLDFDD